MRLQHVGGWRQKLSADARGTMDGILQDSRDTPGRRKLMKHFTDWMGSLFKRFGWQGVVPTGNMPPDNTERFDTRRRPEQYEEYVDQRRPNEY
jgi:hypothetical protein